LKAAVYLLEKHLANSALVFFPDIENDQIALMLDLHRGERIRVPEIVPCAL
jgi:hypothetical protein